MGRPRKTTPGPYLLHMEVLRDRIADHERYPFNLPAVRALSVLPFHPRVTFLVGENGSGKSTLIEAIAVASGLNAEGGSVNFTFATRATHSPLGECIRLAKALGRPRDSYFLRAESFYNVATEIERLDQGPGGPPIIDGYGGRSLHEQSHGESFFSLFKHRFRDHGLYLLDEPEAALSPTRALEFLVLMHDSVRRGCQFVIATHSPIIMAYPDARIHLLDRQGIRDVAYTDTDHYRVTRRFLTDPERALETILREEPEADAGAAGNS